MRVSLHGKRDISAVSVTRAVGEQEAVVLQECRHGIEVGAETGLTVYEENCITLAAVADREGPCVGDANRCGHQSSSLRVGS